MFNMLRGLVCAGLATALCACATAKLDVYNSILPAGYQLKSSSAPVDAASLKTKKLVVLASANFNAYAKKWADRYERGGEQSAGMQSLRAFAKAGGAMVSDKSYDVLGKAMDPRQFSDLMIAALEPYFASVEVAPDLATARDQGAQYYGVLDYWASATVAGQFWSGESHVTLLDDKLVETLRVEGSATESRSVNPFQDVIAVDAAVVQRVLDKNVAQIRKGLAERLGPPPVQSAAPKPAS